MRLTLAAVLMFVAASSANAQPRPEDAFAGQAVGDIVCGAESTLTQSACLVLWREHEEALLQQSVERLLTYAREQDARHPFPNEPTGYVASVTEAQHGWLESRDRECSLATLDDVGGSIRRLSYPNCQASLTLQRRKQLDRVLVLWQAEFEDSSGEQVAIACVLNPTAFEFCQK